MIFYIIMTIVIIEVDYDNGIEIIWNKYICECPKNTIQNTKWVVIVRMNAEVKVNECITEIGILTTNKVQKTHKRMK